MATTTAIKKRRKLVFDVSITVGGVGTTIQADAWVLCAVPTSFSVFSRNQGIQGDRHSSLLQDYPALTRSASYAARQQRQVRAWFVPSGFVAVSGTATITPARVRKLATFLNFVDQSVSRSTVLVPPTDTFVTENGFVRKILRGQDATFTRLFQVRISASYSNPGSGTLRGQLYVHRLHSLEI